MLQATCIQKFRDKHNQIYGYRLQDSTGAVKDVKPESLKNAIRNKQISITNLTLTSDNRLIEASQPNKKQHKSHNQPSVNQKSDANKVLEKMKLLGIKPIEIKTYCGNYCYLVSKSKIDHIIIIPDNVTQINNCGREDFMEFTSAIKRLRGHIKVIGGNRNTSTAGMFERCKAQSLDLSSFNTSNVTDMYSMFWRCETPELDLSSFDTSNVTNMCAMFEECEAKSINLSSFNTSNVTNMRKMFSGCRAQSLDLSTFDTSNVTNMKEMFYCCKARLIDLSSFNTSKITEMTLMFNSCYAESLDLSSFDTSNVTSMTEMFNNCKAQYFNLSSFNTSKVVRMNDMFMKCKTQLLDLSSFDTSNVTDMFKMFSRCEIESLDLSSFDISRVNMGLTTIFDYFKIGSVKINTNDKTMQELVDNFIYKNKEQ